jgi:diguanylate cyclase (GGDEF)-like protein
MTTDRRSETSIGARMRHEKTPINWGAWGAPPARANAVPAAAHTRRKVLLVAAEEATRVARREALAPFDVQVVEVPGVSEALAAVTAGDFALIILEIPPAQLADPWLPVLLRRGPEEPGVPSLFILPARADSADLQAAYRAGAVDCLVDAPLEGELLRQKAVMLFEMHSARAALRAALDHAQTQDRVVAALELRLKDQLEVLRKQATHDMLTGLPNRALFEDRLDGALRRARRSGQQVALALVDLDRFRQVNEEFGYSAGDELIAATGRNLLGAVRTSDTVAHFGVDRFGVVLEGMSGSAGDYLAHKLVRAAAQPCLLLADPHGAPTQVRPQASLALAIYPDHAREREELVTAVEMTLKQVKLAGGGTRVYDGGVLVSDSPAIARPAVVGRIPRS